MQLGFETLNCQEDVCLIRYLKTYKPPASFSKRTVQKEMFQCFLGVVSA